MSFEVSGDGFGVFTERGAVRQPVMGKPITDSLGKTDRGGHAESLTGIREVGGRRGRFLQQMKR